MDLNVKFTSKFNQSFTNRGCLHCAFYCSHCVYTVLSTVHTVYTVLSTVHTVFTLCFLLFTLCLHCAILKALYGFKKKKKNSQGKRCNFSLKNVQNEIFKILKMLVSNRDKNTTLVIFLFCHYGWSLLRWTYWRSLMLWNSTSHVA